MLIDLEKNTSLDSESQKQLLELVQKIHVQSIDNEPEQLADTIFELVQKKIEEEKANGDIDEKLSNLIKEFIKTIVQDMANDSASLYTFVFELMKNDSKNESGDIIEAILDGHDNGLPDILRDIIKQNKWDGDQMQMDANYQVTIGNDLHLQKDQKGNPIVQKPQGTQNIKFILTSKGFLIMNTDGNQKWYLMTETVEMNNGESCWMKWQEKQDNHDYSDLWSLNVTSDNQVIIEKLYGEQRPQMTVFNKNITTNSQVKTTTLVNDGFGKKN